MAFEDLLHPLLSAYIASPQWLKSSLGHLYSILPRSLRHGGQYSLFQQEAALHDPIALERLCRAKLADALGWALDTVPFYAPYAHLRSQLADPYRVLAQLPLISKNQIKADPDAFMSLSLPPSKRLKTFTGGSTANPMQFNLQKGVSRTKEYAFMASFHRRVGLNERGIVLALRGRTVPTAATGGPFWMYEPIKRQLILSCDHLERQNMPKYMAAIRKWKPDYIEAYPSALVPLARWLSDHPDPALVKSIKGILLYSENVYEDQLVLLRKVFSCPILKHYGHSERVLAAASMPDDERCFFWPQYGYLELLDENDVAVTTPGRLGEIVGTGFDNKAMAFVRYRTGDLAVLSEVAHPLLPGYPVVERIEGRLQEFLVCNDQRLISICTMGAAHFAELAAVEALQYEQLSPGHVVLKVVERNPLSQEARDNIVNAVLSKTQGGCSAEIMTVAEIPRTARGKHQMLIQHLDISAYYGASQVTADAMDK